MKSVKNTNFLKWYKNYKNVGPIDWYIQYDIDNDSSI